MKDWIYDRLTEFSMNDWLPQWLDNVLDRVLFSGFFHKAHGDD